jgi:methyl-accepting chemotaxis protein
MIKNLKIWQKFALITVAMSLPIAVLVYLLVADKNVAINFSRKEQVGLTYLHPLRNLLEQVQSHQRATDAGNSTAATSSLARIDETFKELDSLDRQLGKDLGTTEKFTALKVKWQGVNAVDAKGAGEEHDQFYEDFLSDTHDLYLKVGDASNLILDSQLDSYYIVEGMLLRLPENQDMLNKIWDMGQGVAARGTVTDSDKNELVAWVAELHTNMEETKGGFATVFNNNPSGTAKALMQTKYDGHVAATEAFADLITKRIVESPKVDVKREEFEAAAARALTASYQLWDLEGTTLSGMFDDRIASLHSREYTTLSVVALVVLFTIMMALFIVRSINRPLKEAVDFANRLAKGDLSAEIMSTSTDETGQLLQAMNRMSSYLKEMAAISDQIATGNLKVELQPRSAQDRFGNAFKNMIVNTLSLVQSQDERDEIQKSIMKLLDEIGDVALGDLTVEAEVTTNATGAIADSFNYMISELRKVIHNVNDATLLVSSSATEIQATTEHLATGSEEQSMQIMETSSAMEEMAVSIQQVSENAGLSATVADQARANAKQGMEAVQNNITAMSRIRGQVQETSKQIKRLGERSQEIGEIIQLIDDIADRTSMLALNASIQAAMAGEAGRGFAVVAEEVERLADRSTNATKQISTLIKSIQSETNEVVAAMEETTREVVEGSDLANEAGQALNEIDAVSHRLAELIQQISQASNQQARGSEAIAKSMTTISDVTQQVAAGSKQATVSVGGLVTLADNLRSSVITFKLPGSNGNGNHAQR